LLERFNELGSMMCEGESDGFTGVLGDVADDVAVLRDCADVNDVAGAGDAVPVVSEPSLVYPRSFVQDVQVRVPVAAIGGKLDLEEGGTAGSGGLPSRCTSEEAEGRDQVVELIGEWEFGVTQSEGDESKASILDVLEYVLGDAESFFSCAGNAESVAAVSGADRVAVGVVRVTDHPCSTAAPEESFAAGRREISFGHRESDAESVGLPA